MSFLSRLRIAQRLALSFGATILLVVVVSLVAVTGVRVLNASLHDVTGRGMATVRDANVIGEALEVEARAAAASLLLDMDTDRAAELDKFAAENARSAQAYAELGRLVSTGEGRRLLAAMQVERQSLDGVMATFSKAVRDGDIGTARGAWLNDVRPRIARYQSAVSAFSARQQSLMTASVAAADARVAQTTLVLAVLGAVAAAIAVAASILAARSITRPLAVAVGAAERVAAGDLSADIAVRGRDETAQLLSAMRRMSEGLRHLVGQVRQSSDSIATGSTQIANGNADLSQRTEEQASNLQQTAASMEQLTATVRQNAETAAEAARLAAEAAGAAEQGGAVVGDVVRTMDEISGSSQRIGEIIGVIDGIAFQTNILALNAAVEAARAGEQGRGFAVVAGEVRALAQRSGEAAREIKQLIGQSVDRVADGGRLVGDAGRAMADLVGRVRRVNELVSEISSSSAEQSRGIDQIGDAVGQLDRVTQQNAALVEESAAAAESLRVQADALARAVGSFRLQDA